MSPLDALINHPVIRIFLTGSTGVPLASAARTDAATPGTVHVYESGSNIVIQIRGASAWRSVTLS